MKHILIIGFKHVGKTSVGKELAKRLNKKSIDLDDIVEKIYFQETGKYISVREIVIKVGLERFQKIERKALIQALATDKQSVIALGGGTPIKLENQELIKQHIVVHLTADKSNVYERIMVNGRPAFFPEDEEAYTAFLRIWNEREEIYKKLARYTVKNNGTFLTPVKELINILKI